MAGPLTPPIGTRFSTGEDLNLLSDGAPTTPPLGAVVINAGDHDGEFPTWVIQPNTVYWFGPGVHTFGTSQFSQIVPKDGDTFVGAPGAIIDGQNANLFFLTGGASNVTVRYLEIRNFICYQDQTVINHDFGTGWTLEYLHVHNNTGGACGLGASSILRYSWLHDNRQYAFNGASWTEGASGYVIDHCEMAYNGSLLDEQNHPAGNNGCGKFWAVQDLHITNCWVHDNLVGIWADTNNVDLQLENNLIENTYGEAFFYEISYNFLCKNNTLRRNALGKGREYAARNDNFPIAAIYISEAGSDPAVGRLYNNRAEITGNTFIDNWNDITLWENSDRFCNSPSNTSGKQWAPLGHGASLAICNNPLPKTLTVNLVAGSADFTVTAGTFEWTDEGRPCSGSGIPVGTTIQFPPGDTGFVSGTSGRMTANATSTANSVTMTLAAGAINTEPGFTACRWHTENVWVHDNTFDHDQPAVLSGTTLPAGVRTACISIISQYGTVPDWSPYKAYVVSEQIVFQNNNVWENNTYRGPYSFTPYERGNYKTFTQWRASPYFQDVGSTISATPNPPTIGPRVWANVGMGHVRALAIHTKTTAGRVTAVNRIGRLT